MKQEIFKEHMADMFTCFSRKVDEEVVKAYWGHLKHFKDGEFVGACDNILKKERFFPTIAVFCSYIEGESQWI